MLQTMLNDMFVLTVPVLEKVLRTVLVYALLLVLLRLAGRRELAQLNPFDLVVLLMLSNTVQNAIIGEDNTLIGGIIGAVVLICSNHLVVRYLFRHRSIERTIEGDPTLLIRDGALDRAEMRREMITKHQLTVAARRQGIDSLDEVENADLDAIGSFTFDLKRPTIDERRHQELLDRIDRLSAELAALRSQQAM